jgi:hypothetical protein
VNEEKSEQEIISEEITKAQKAMFLLKKHTKYMDSVSGITHDDCENFYLYKHTVSFEDVIAPIQRYLKNSYDRLMKSNTKKQKSEFRPIKVKNMEKPMATKKKPVAKPTKKVSKKMVKKATTKRTSK